MASMDEGVLTVLLTMRYEGVKELLSKEDMETILGQSFESMEEMEMYLKRGQICLELKSSLN